MKLGDLLSLSEIFTDVQAKDKGEALNLLVDLLITAGRLRLDQRKTVTDALLARERVASTGLGDGVALPHATVDGLDEVVAALAISPEGIPFESQDGLPASLLVLLLVPRKSFQVHIKTLSGVARLLHSGDMREALRNARTPQEVLDILQEEEKAHPPE